MRWPPVKHWPFWVTWDLPSPPASLTPSPPGPLWPLPLHLHEHLHCDSTFVCSALSPGIISVRPWGEIICASRYDPSSALPLPVYWLTGCVKFPIPWVLQNQNSLNLLSIPSPNPQFSHLLYFSTWQHPTQIPGNCSEFLPPPHKVLEFEVALL